METKYETRKAKTQTGCDHGRSSDLLQATHGAGPLCHQFLVFWLGALRWTWSRSGAAASWNHKPTHSSVFFLGTHTAVQKQSLEILRSTGTVKINLSMGPRQVKICHGTVQVEAGDGSIRDTRGRGRGGTHLSSRSVFGGSTFHLHADSC